MPPLGPKEIYKPSLSPDENEMVKLSSKEHVIADAMDGLIQTVRDARLSADRNLLSAFKARDPLVRTPRVYYVTEGLPEDVRMAAWIQERAVRKRGENKTLYTQVVRPRGEEYDAVSEPEPRVAAIMGGSRSLYVHSVSLDLLTPDKRTQLVHDIADVIDLIRIAVYPELQGRPDRGVLAPYQ